MKKFFVIYDELHAEDIGEFDSLESVNAKLRELAKLPWNTDPNKAPCKGWESCGRDYGVIEYDATSSLGTEISRTAAFSITAQGIVRG